MVSTGALPVLLAWDDSGLTTAAAEALDRVGRFGVDFMTILFKTAV
jgi:hypothetical protein